MPDMAAAGHWIAKIVLLLLVVLGVMMAMGGSGTGMFLAVTGVVVLLYWKRDRISRMLPG